LHQALCMVKRGDSSGGASYTDQVLAELPDNQRRPADRSRRHAGGRTDSDQPPSGGGGRHADGRAGRGPSRRPRRATRPAVLFVRGDNPARLLYRSWGWSLVGLLPPQLDSPRFEALLLPFKGARAQGPPTTATGTGTAT